MNFKIPKKSLIITLTGFFIFTFYFFGFSNKEKYTLTNTHNGKGEENNKDKKFIKYAEFNVNYKALEKAMKFDINSQKEDIKLNWIDILAFLGSKYGGEFNSRYKDQDIDKLIEELKSGKKIEELAEKMKYFSYYRQVYGAVLGEFLGKYEIQTLSNFDPDNPVYEERYGLKAFSPIAKTFPFQHFKDFGSTRDYGYSRPHLGHDLMCATGTPVIAIESGVVECIGWNQYGGWRIGIRSFDRKRYYYYAHLRKNRPYQSNLKEKHVVRAGDVIGYVGRTGYSRNENVNNIDRSHLHVGLQLIFDESQKECINEIWIDLYAITQLLQKNRCEVRKDNDSKEYSRRYTFIEESVKKAERENSL